LKHTFVRATVAACALTFGAGAYAAGFQLLEQSLTGLGRSYAGAGVVGDDLSAVQYNAAGMTLLDGTRVQQNAIWASMDFEYRSNDGSVRENGRDKPTTIPSGFFTHQFNDQVWFGLGLTAPYGMKTRYDGDWGARDQGISGSILTVDINPNIAWKVNNWLSIGGGVSALYTHSKVKNGFTKMGVSGEFEYKGDDWMFTYNLGLMLTPIETVRLGLSYRSSAKVNAKGDYTMRVKNYGMESTVYGYGRLETPETVMLSGSWETTPNLRLSGLVRWSNWKNFDTMSFNAKDSGELIKGLMNSNPAVTNMLMANLGSQAGYLVGRLQEGLSSVSMDNYWKAAWLFTLGADYKINDQWTIRGGLGLETDPIKNPRNRTAVIPDTKRLWLSCGFSYVPNKNWQFDVGYAHLRGIGNDKLYTSAHDTKPQEVQGHFRKLNAYLVGGAIQYRF
jgi:long-chain fatty acid transport protein